MSEDGQSKICPLCAETIKAAAKVCPHCRTWQKKWSFQNPQTTQSIAAICWVILISVGVIGVGFFFDNLIGNKRDFAPYQNQIAVVNSERSFRIAYSNLTVSVVGVVTNQSDFSWKNVALEAQFFNKAGQLIDVIQADGDYRGITVISHNEAAFRIEAKAAKPESEYASQQVFIRSAKDIKSWP